VKLGLTLLTVFPSILIGLVIDGLLEDGPERALIGTDAKTSLAKVLGNVAESVASSH